MADVPAGGTRPPYRQAALAAAAVLLVYVLTLAPTVTFWDAGEFITAAKTLGIPHPPATPLFVLLGHVWALLLPLGEYAVRTNLLSATASAVGAGFFFLVVRESIVRAWDEADSGWTTIAAFAATSLGAFTFTNWQNSNETEVYAAATCMIAIVCWLVLVWRRRRAEPRADRFLLLAVYVFGLAVGTHLLALLAGPAVLTGVYVIQRRTPARSPAEQGGERAVLLVLAATWVLLVGGGLGNALFLGLGLAAWGAAAVFAATRGRIGFALSALALAIVGATPYLFAFIRAGQHPPINEADPSTWQALLAVVGRQQYGVRTPFDDPTVFHGPDNPGRPLTLIGLQVLNYFQYLDWQWARGLAAKIGAFPLRTLVTLAMVSLGVRGLRVQRRADREAWWMLFVLFLTTGAGLVAYMNFKAGYSIGYDAYPSGADHEVRERDYFFVVSFVVWGLWAGIGAADLVRRARLPGYMVLARAGLLGAVAALPVAANWTAATRQGPDARLAADAAYNLLNSVPPYGILFTYGDNDTFPLWWAQEVAGVRRDVTVVCLALANTDWYMRQLARLQPAPFDAAAAPAVWRGRAGERPTWPLHTMDDSTVARASRSAARLDQPLDVNFGPFTKTYPVNTIFQPSDIVSIQILRQNLGRRPIVFAVTTGADFLGLRDHAVMQGLGYRIEAKVDSSAPGLDRSRFNAAPLDVALTDSLAWSAYRYGAIDGRADPELEPTATGFANSFALPFTQLAFAYSARGDSVRAVRNLERAAALSADSTLRVTLRQVRGR